MSLTSTPSLWIPRHSGFTSGHYDVSTLLVDAAGEKAAFVLRVPATGALKKVGFRTGSVTQNQTIRVSFQDVDPTTGYPDGGADQWRNISIADTDDNVPKETGLITSDGTDSGSLRSVTRGDLLAVVFEHDPFVTGNIFRLSMVATGGGDCEGGTYCALYTTSWSRVAQAPCLALIYDDGGSDVCYYCATAYPCTQDYYTMSYSSNSTISRRGLKFTLPFIGRLWGAMVRMRSTASFAVRLYDSDGVSVLRSYSADGPTTEASFIRWHHIPFATPVQLTKDTPYYLMIEPTTTSSIFLAYMDVPAGREYYWDQMDGGRNFHYAERASGAPTDIRTRRPLISLEIEAVDDGAGIMRPGPWGMIR